MHIDYTQLYLYLELILRLFLALLLGGIIGYEREHTHRPAGFRTHILVCVGSALVMVTSEYIFRRYSGIANIDPARLGAQVVSGIGFLGAGTIIREGFSVKGLTTAASLWAVSCVGIAVGIGFYEGAIVATILIYITLIMLKKIEGQFAGKSPFRTILIQGDGLLEKMGRISEVFKRHNLSVRSMEFIQEDQSGPLSIRFLLKGPRDLTLDAVAPGLFEIGGIVKVIDD